jgi:hypothetical protein
VNTRRLAAGAAGLLSCLVVSGCGGGAHEVLLASQADSGTVTLTYQIDDRHPVNVSSQQKANDSAGVITASVDLPMKTGTHVRITGSSSSTSATAVSCTVAVDSAVKEARISTAPATGTLATPLRCATEAYVGHRPYGLNHIFEVLAFVVSLLIVVAALGSLVVNRRRG